ncbi:mCG146874 [Mus musculus]|nr:mCG146874 [Mus musculus]
MQKDTRLHGPLYWLSGTGAGHHLKIPRKGHRGPWVWKDVLSPFSWLLSLPLQYDEVER